MTAFSLAGWIAAAVACVIASASTTNAAGLIEEAQALEIARRDLAETRDWTPDSYALAVSFIDENEVLVLIIPMTHPGCGSHLYGMSGCAFEMRIDRQTGEVLGETKIGQPEEGVR